MASSTGTSFIPKRRLYVAHLQLKLYLLAPFIFAFFHLFIVAPVLFGLFLALFHCFEKWLILCLHLFSRTHIIHIGSTSSLCWGSWRWWSWPRDPASRRFDSYLLRFRWPRLNFRRRF